MSLILRLVCSSRFNMEKLDIKQCLADLAISNKDGLNDQKVMQKMHAIVFKYNIYTNKLERVFIERNLKVACDWVDHVNEKSNKSYHVMIYFDANNCYLWRAYKCNWLGEFILRDCCGFRNPKRRPLMHHFRRLNAFHDYHTKHYIDNCMCDICKACLIEMENSDNNIFGVTIFNCMCYICKDETKTDAIGNCMCDICKEYYMMIGENMSRKSYKIALALCSCDDCKIKKQTRQH